MREGSPESKGLLFRSMRLEDIETICEIERESFPTPWTAAAFTNELTYNQFARYLVVECENEIAGYCGMWVIIDEAHITNIALKKKFRGRKLGEKLLREAQSLASELGASRMTLEVRPSNVIAQHLYRKLGFLSSGIRRGYYTDNGEDAIIMWADITKKKPGAKDRKEEFDE